MTNIFGEARLNDVTAVAWSDIWRRWFLRRRFKLILIHIELHFAYEASRRVEFQERSSEDDFPRRERERSIVSYRFITVLISRTQREITLWLLRDAETPPTSATFPKFRTIFQKTSHNSFSSYKCNPWCGKGRKGYLRLPKTGPSHARFPYILRQYCRNIAAM